MTRLAMFLTTMGALMFSSGVSAEDYVYGPAPDWSRYKALAEPAIRAKIPEANLGDPADWKIEWPNGYVQAGWAHRGRFKGYLSCGYLQPIAPIGGRYHRTNFVAVIDHDVVQTVDISSHESNSMVNVLCGYLVSRGKMPPASMMSAQTQKPVEVQAADGIGLKVRPMPEGAYVVATVPGSPAERAGLKPGMVLTIVNRIPLANMGPAMVALLGADSATLSLETVTGQHIEVRKGP